MLDILKSLIQEIELNAFGKYAVLCKDLAWQKGGKA